MATAHVAEETSGEGVKEDKMPGGDRTGPMGQGAMTGRGLGPCNTSGNVFSFRRGGMGRGRFFNRGFSNFQNTNNETQALLEENNTLRSKLSDLEQRLADLENK